MQGAEIEVLERGLGDSVLEAQSLETRARAAQAERDQAQQQVGALQAEVHRLRSGTEVARLEQQCEELRRVLAEHERALEDRNVALERAHSELKETQQERDALQVALATQHKAKMSAMAEELAGKIGECERLRAALQDKHNQYEALKQQFSLSEFDRIEIQVRACVRECVRA